MPQSTQLRIRDSQDVRPVGELWLEQSGEHVRLNYRDPDGVSWSLLSLTIDGKSNKLTAFRAGYLGSRHVSVDACGKIVV